MGLRSLGLIVAFAGIIALLGLVPPLNLPITQSVPITAQGMGVTIAGVLLGPRRGALAALVFLIAVAAGWPLLAGGRGGYEVFAGPTAGYLVGFVPAAFITGVLFDRLFPRMGGLLAALVAAFVGGYVVLNLIGIPVFSWIAHKSPSQALQTAIGLLPGGIAKAFGTALVAYLAEGLGPRERS